jgi:4-hydroxybenzoate polyprenyltransferase
VKNVFVLPALLFGLAGGVASSSLGWLLGQTAIAFGAFCLVASGFYALNDVLDAEKDRHHPVKCRRPVASGAVAPSVAIGLGVALIAGSLALAYAGNRMLFLVVLSYAVLQVAYNGFVKRLVFVDVVALATGFALRATAGAVAIRIQVSIWLLLCVFSLCLFLGFIKRRFDLASAEASGSDWKSPAGYDDAAELDWLLGVSAVLSILTYLMYALSDHARSLFGSRAFGIALLSPLVMITMHRFFRRARRGQSESPLTALLEDRVVLVSCLLFVSGVLVCLYVEPAQRILDRLFLPTG